MEYQIEQVQRRNEWDSKYGTMMDYALSLGGQSGWIKLTQKLDTPPPKEGDTVYGSIEDKVNKNGTSYRKFTKQQKGYGGGQQSVDLSSVNKKLDEILSILRDSSTDSEDDEVHDPFEALL